MVPISLVISAGITGSNHQGQALKKSERFCLGEALRESIYSEQCRYVIRNGASANSWQLRSLSSPANYDH